MNCIGYNNHKCFISMLFWISITCVIIVSTYSRPFYYIIINPRASLIKCYLAALEMMISLLLGGVISYFFIFHIWLVCKGMTTAEYNSKYKNQQIKPRSDFDISCWENLKETFGSNIFEWFIPFSIILIRYECRWI